MRPDKSGFVNAFETHNDTQITQDFIISDIYGCSKLKPEQYSHLKRRVSAKFDIDPHDVLVVGSAKLGFSIAPKKRWKAFDSDVEEIEQRSDIDVAIVSSQLYLKIWQQISQISHDLPQTSRKNSEWHTFHANGWIRPDKLPNYNGFTLRQDWFEFFRQLTNERVCGQVKIAAGLYYSMDFLTQYQNQSVIQCREELQLGDSGN